MGGRKGSDTQRHTQDKDLSNHCVSPDLPFQTPVKEVCSGSRVEVRGPVQSKEEGDTSLENLPCAGNIGVSKVVGESLWHHLPLNPLENPAVTLFV